MRRAFFSVERAASAEALGAATLVSISPKEAPLPWGGRLRAGGCRKVPLLVPWVCPQSSASAGPCALLFPPRDAGTLFLIPSPLSGETGNLTGRSWGRAGGPWLRSVTGQLAGREKGSLLSAASFPRVGVPAEPVIYSGHNSAVGLVRVGNMLVFPSQV